MGRLLGLLLTVASACAVDPAIAPRDCTPGQVVACACPGVNGSQTCDATGRLGSCECPDAGPARDAGSSLDVAAEDRPDVLAAPDMVDVGPSLDVADASSPPVDAGRCPNGLRAVCDGRSVSLQSGEVDGGIRYHCGACGHTCAAGEFCVQCQCTP